MNLVEEFLRHNAQMNGLLLRACASLTGGQLVTSVPGTYGGIGETFVHIANSQIGYVPNYLIALKPEPLPKQPFPGFRAVAERLSHGNALLEELASRAAESHEIEVSGDDPPGTWRMPASLVLLQAVNHGTEHRSQIATILTQLGIDPPAMDGWTYFFDRGLMVEV